MMGTLSNMIVGIAVNYISNKLLPSLSQLKEEKQFRLFKKSLEDWIFQFEKNNDGSIVTSGRFVGFVESNHVVEDVVNYVFSHGGDANRLDETSFLEAMKTQIVVKYEQIFLCEVSYCDKIIISDFIKGILYQTKEFVIRESKDLERDYNKCQQEARNREERLAYHNEEMKLLQEILFILHTCQPFLEDKTQLPPEFDELIISHNKKLQQSLEKFRDPLSRDETDFCDMYVLPSLKIHMSDGKTCQIDSKKHLGIPNLFRLYDRAFVFPKMLKKKPELKAYVSKAYLMELECRNDSTEKRQQTINTLFDQSNIVYVIGGAGCGKSHFLKKLCIAPQELTDYKKKPFLIISGEFKQMIKRDGQFVPMLDYLKERFAQAGLQTPNELAPNFLERCLKAGRCLILLDALDEVADDQRNILHRSVIKYFQETMPNNKVCITSRDRAFIPEEHITCFSICPITIQIVMEYVDRAIDLGKFPLNERKQFIEKISSLMENDNINSFLMLSLLLYIYKNNWGFPDDKVTLYELYFEYIANAREKEKNTQRKGTTGKEYDWAMLDMLLDKRTFMNLAQEGTPNNQYIRREQIHKIIFSLYQDRFRNGLACGVATEQFLQFCADRTEIFVPSPSNNMEYCFFHRAFYEYFYASYLIHIKAGPESIYQKLTQAGLDSELFELLVAMYYKEDPKQVRELLQYTFKRAGNLTQNYTDTRNSFNNLVMLVRNANEDDFTQRFIKLFMECGSKISGLPGLAGFELVKGILKKDLNFFQKIYYEKQELYEEKITRDVASFLRRNRENCYQLLSYCNEFDLLSWTLTHQNFRYACLLELLPDKLSLMARIFDKLILTQDDVDLSTFARKVRACPDLGQEKIYTLLLPLLTYGT